MPWNSILKLYLLNSILAGPVNSARDPQKIVHGIQRKKRRHAKQRRRVAIETQPKIIFILLWVFGRRDGFFGIKFLLFPATEF